MQTPNSNTSMQKTVSAARWHAVAITLDPAVAALASTFEPTLARLLSTLAASDDANAAKVAPRVRVRFAETALESTLGDCYNECKKKGNEAALALLFGGGKTAEIRPRGEAQLERTRSVFMVALGKLDAASSVRTTYEPILTTSLDAFSTALAERRAAALAAASATVDLDLAKEDMVSALRSNAGFIQSVYPRDSALRDRFFEDVRESSSNDAPDPPPADPTT
jgi:hypothetical protein